MTHEPQAPVPLLPCPFCGGRAVSFARVDVGYEPDVHCLNSDCGGYAETITAWNRRAPSAGVAEPVAGPDSFSAEGKFFLALDNLTRMTWRWGESCGIDDVSWDDIGDSYNESCRDDHRKARRAVVEAHHAAVAEKAHPAPSPDAETLRRATEALEAARWYVADHQESQPNDETRDLLAVIDGVLT